ncbi:MAG: peroxidase [Calditrichaeota bacterium]|nr:MAG: peroxidase [Calditrichota bacterium]
MRSLGGIDDSLKEKLTADFRNADLSNDDILILEYAEKITKNPSSITNDDITRLLDFGFSQSAIHDMAQVTSYFNYVNRIADSLGVELETD